MALAEVRGGAVILSASGMCEAGRVKYHLANNLPRPECTVLITGFQAAGTLGRRLIDGARNVRIFGQPVPVGPVSSPPVVCRRTPIRRRCSAGCAVSGASAGQTFVVHGEPEAAGALATALRRDFGWPDVEVPAYGSEWRLSGL